MVASVNPVRLTPTPAAHGFHEKLNARWHKPALQLFMLVVLAHWAEHLVQAFQIYALGWPVPESRGVLGHWFPWLVKSETLHYSYAIVMLVGLWTLRQGFRGTSRRWWTAALAIQFWHHIEHGLLLGQAAAGQNFFGSPVPVSVAQMWIPRVELHLFYNTVVFIPMVVGMYFHMFPRGGEAAAHGCSCALR
ncbi:MAG TPA: hypothetical protein VF659_12470 [Pyrinomonadaceae bacterium]|jgi:hypothetical protein